MSNPRKANGHRYRTMRARLLARPNPVCHLCNQPIDKTLHHHDPGALEWDHDTPVSRGGAMYSMANARVAHRLCNQRKGNRPTIPGGPSEAAETPAKPSTSRTW